MTKEGPEKILEVLRNKSSDEKISKFLECIFSKELEGIHFWSKEYEKNLKDFSKDWDDKDEN